MSRGMSAKSIPAAAGATVLSDQDLLQRFLEQHAEAAFAELVRRHGPMVLRVCQRALHHAQDAEDAFQATFVVLMRKAKDVLAMPSVAAWLYGVAYRTACNGRKMRANRRYGDERQMNRPMQSAEPSADDVRPILDDELSQLPEYYRDAVVLCYLEGRTTEEAAQQLGCSRGTIGGRLARARELLRDRLARRGLTLSATAFGTLLAQETSQAAVSPALVQATTTTAMGRPLPLAGFFHSLAGAKLKLVAWAVAAVVVMGAVIYLLIPSSSSQGRWQLRATLSQHTEPVRALALTRDGRLLASGSDDHTIVIWQIGRAQPRSTLRGHTATVTALAFAANGRLLLSGSTDQTVRVWDVPTASARATLRHPGGGVESLAVFPNGQTVVACGPNAFVAGFNLRTLQDGIRLWQSEDGYRNTCISPDGQLIAAGQRDGRVRVWQTGQISPDFQELNPPRPGVGSWVRHLRFTAAGWVRLLGFTPDNKFIFTAHGTDNGEQVQRWAVNTGDSLAFTLPGKVPVHAAALAPDGNTLVLAERNQGPVHLLDVASQRVIAILPNPGSELICCEVVDAYTMAIGYRDGTIQVWQNVDKPQGFR